MKTPDPHSVFINVPFDRDYERLLVALIAGIVAVGRKPRSILEFGTPVPRLDRLVTLIEACAVSIHDLSRVERTRTPLGMVPRFNMPFELGLACAHTFHGQHRFFIFEKRPHRLFASTSDLDGYEPRIHNGTSEGVLRGVLDMLGPGPGLPELRRLDRRLARAVGARSSPRSGTSLFTRELFKNTVVSAAKLAADLGLIASTKRAGVHHA